jgi:hypothetical protein
MLKRHQPQAPPLKGTLTISLSRVFEFHELSQKRPHHTPEMGITGLLIVPTERRASHPEE